MNQQADDFPILAIDYLQFYVGNASKPRTTTKP